MAKSSSFFGLRTGSTKSLTFQVLKGQQITKDRVTRVANPRTDAQMQQRAVLPMVAAARSALKGLIDHSFEGVPYGEQSLRKFSQLNLRKNALNVESYTPYGYSNPGFSDLIVANGSINVQPEISLVSEGARDKFASAVFIVSAFKSFKFKAASAMTEGSKILKQISDYAVANHVELFQPGTQFTFLSCTKAGEVGERSAPLSKFTINRILMPGEGVTTAEDNEVNGTWRTQEAVTEGTPSVVLYNNIGDAILITVVENGLRFGVVPFGSRDNEAFLAAIVSKNEAGVWKRSFARLTQVKDISNRYTFEDWKANFESAATSNKYLNSGSDPVGIRS